MFIVTSVELSCSKRVEHALARFFAVLYAVAIFHIATGSTGFEEYPYAFFLPILSFQF